MNYQIEICANSAQSAMNAERGGANRIELCDNLWEGGTTPSMGTIEWCKKNLSIPVFVLIRPRGGDFVYSDIEFDLMKRDILWAKTLGIHGVVSGVLKPDATIDRKRTAELIELAKPLAFTFHRAFDLTPNPIESLNILIELGVQRVLTSGLQENVDAGISTLEELFKLAGNKITILPGGGVNEHNILKLKDIGCREFHFSAKATFNDSMQLASQIPMNGSKVIPENKLIMTDPEIVKKMKGILDEAS